MAQVRRTPQAEADLVGILDDLDVRTPAAADRYASAFRIKAAALAQFPELGRARPELGPGLRSVLVPPYVLFYRHLVAEDEVQIVRILHGRRDLNNILHGEPNRPE